MDLIVLIVLLIIVAAIGYFFFFNSEPSVKPKKAIPKRSFATRQEEVDSQGINVCSSHYLS
jgi:flagellar basal body-associated protein FliL